MYLRAILRGAFLSMLLLVGVVYANEANTYTEDKLNITADPQHAEFVIKLKSNPTTGYSWFLREYNHELLTPVAHHFQAPSTDLIGAAGYELWSFRLKPMAFVVPQQTVIRFTYARPWQRANDTQVVFRVTTVAKK